ncbi:transcriptional regulator, partial [Klebsiella michiganensis]
YVEDDELATIVMNYEKLSEDNKKTIIKIIDKNNMTK